MKSYDQMLERVTEALQQGNCGRAIQEMETYLTAWPEQHTQEKLERLKEDYRLMEQHWLTGDEDPQRQTFYQRLLGQLYVLYANVLHYHRMKASPYQYSLYIKVRQKGRDWSLGTIRKQLEGFVSDVAMLQLEPEHTRKAKTYEVYHQHQQQMNDLFQYVLTSRQWTDSVGSQFAEMMTSPTIDSIDQQLIVSAVTLALINQFDMAKFRLLTDVYQQSTDEAVKQRALIGWVLALNSDAAIIYPEEESIVRRLLQSEDVCQELHELQIQLVYCLKESQDSDIIRGEIMPELIKGKEFQMSRLGLTEQEETPLEEILHPEIADERMEKLENLYQKMVDMQKEGSDIFYSSFSQMKRYPFFYDISNWLTPFYMEHPDIQNYAEKMADNKFARLAVRNPIFCDSDKYSYVIAFESIASMLPENLREMMRRGEATFDKFDINEDDIETPTMLRRSYLMDLYRFFRLFPHRQELSDPFSLDEHHWEFFSLPMLMGTPLDKHKRDVVRMLRKNQFLAPALRVLNTFPEELRDVDYYLWTENLEEGQKRYSDDERIQAAVARLFFRMGKYDQATEWYVKLMERFPDNRRYMLNAAICQVNSEHYEEALKLLYQLNYENSEDFTVCRALAWALTCSDKVEQATRYYEQLAEQGQLTTEDYHNYGCNLWLQQRMAEAATQFRKYDEARKASEKDGTNFSNESKAFFADDVEWLHKRGISDIEIKLMESYINI